MESKYYNWVNSMSAENKEGSMRKKDYDQDLNMLDNDTLLLVLSIGDSKVGHLKLQKMVYILSRVGNTENHSIPYKFGMFDENLMEKLQAKGQDLITMEDAKYLLTEKGKDIYYIVREKVEKKKPKVVSLSEVLRKMNEDELLAVAYYLFPEATVESEITHKVSKAIDMLLHRRGPFSIEKKNGEVIIKIEE